MAALDAILLLLAALGHVFIWAGVLGQVLATATPLWANRVLERAVQAAMVLGPAVGIFWAWRQPITLDPRYDLERMPRLGLAYLAACICWAIVVVGRSIRRAAFYREPNIVNSTTHSVVDVPARIGHLPVRGLARKWLSRLPGNDTLKIEINQKEIVLNGMDQRLHGLSIAHFSDLHLDNRVELAYFREAVSFVRDMQADMVALSGDIVDEADQIHWLSDLLGPITARYGKYFILGNHDLKVGDIQAVRDALTAAGFIDLGSQVCMLEINRCRVLLAGDELPWIRPGPEGRLAGFDEDQALRILLAHSPDRFRWAQHRRFDLVLSGHTHGGQLRFPLLGPLVSPCRGGTRHSAGIFQERGTFMHVSRGLSDTFPIRLNCPAELTRLVLRSPQATHNRQ